LDPDFQPTLTGGTVIVRPIRPDDWTELFAAAADPDIWKLHPFPDRCTEPVFRQFFDNAVASKAAFVFVHPPTGELIGSSRYHGYDPALSEIEIGWTFVVRKHWGRGVNSEAKHMMLTHAFKFVDTVILWVGDRNWQSQRAVEKIGGIKRPGIFVRDLTGSSPHLIYDIKKDGYQRGPDEGRQE
jgi:RimJ/RimL family protein N-acetyltransferase